MSEIKYEYFKHPSREFNEQTIVRMKFIENSNDWEDTEMLIAGYVMHSGIKFSLYDFKYSEQRLLPDHEYKNLWSNTKSWLKKN